MTGQLPSILVVDDDRMMLRVLGQMLAAHGDVSFATSARDALILIRAQRPDLVLLDYEMPEMSGTELCRAIKLDPLLTGIPVLFVTSQLDADFEAACFELGAADYIHKPVRPPVLLARLGMQLRLKRMSDELRRIARTDAVTGCANRRVFDEKLQEEWARTRRSGQPLSLALLDIDHFKLFNDHYGHQAGDICLQAFAGLLLRGAARASDLVARYGGEEFALLLPDTDSAGALAVARHVLELLREAAIPHAMWPLDAQLSASIGVATFQPTPAFTARRTDPPPAGLPAAPDLVAAADKALYEAKRSGRRRACFLPCGLAATPTG
ncbi:MAG: diguanylate cyclase [Polyangiales bacterium]